MRAQFRAVIALACALVSVPVSAQTAVPWPWTMPPTFIIPASAVNGGGTVSASLIPSVDNTFDLGSSSLRWRNIYWGTQALGPDGTASAPSYSFASEAGLGWYRNGTNQLSYAAGGTQYAQFNAAGLYLLNNSSFISIGASSDVSLSRGAAGRPEWSSSAGVRIGSTQTTDPTCTSNCGTSPSVVGTDSEFTVTMGSSGVPASGFVITFNGTWGSNPQCVGAMAKTGMAIGKLPMVVVTSTTTVTVTTNGTAPSTSDVYSFICRGGR